MSYGHRIKSTTDDVVLANKELDEYFIRMNIPGKYLVESWPFLLYLPRFLQWFRWEPERHRVRDSKVYLSNMYKVMEQMQNSSAPPSMTTYALERREQFNLSDLELAYALAAPWAAGVETTVASIEVAILAMLRYPDVMRKAQAELDSVVGHGRLPGFEDQTALPYMQALIKETTRWRPIAPTAVPHATTEDDTYKGLFIPKGSTIYANNFAILADPSLFPEPETFRPERFLDDPENKSYKIAFGYGRRVYVPQVDDFTGGLVSRPANLEYRLVPRHKGVVDLIMLEAEKADMEAMAWQ
ncbi:hypothetical protein C0995_013651 [Termitomyces sp. Mi166|nr:hypothetical protein C0995_013651 [Termitomyces sp. Mi166\